MSTDSRPMTAPQRRLRHLFQRLNEKTVTLARTRHETREAKLRNAMCLHFKGPDDRVFKLTFATFLTSTTTEQRALLRTLGVVPEPEIQSMLSGNRQFICIRLVETNYVARIPMRAYVRLETELRTNILESLVSVQTKKDVAARKPSELLRLLEPSPNENSPPMKSTEDEPFSFSREKEGPLQTRKPLNIRVPTQPMLSYTMDDLHKMVEAATRNLQKRHMLTAWHEMVAREKRDTMVVTTPRHHPGKEHFRLPTETPPLPHRQGPNVMEDDEFRRCLEMSKLPPPDEHMLFTSRIYRPTLDEQWGDLKVLADMAHQLDDRNPDIIEFPESPYHLWRLYGRKEENGKRLSWKKTSSEEKSLWTAWWTFGSTEIDSEWMSRKGRIGVRKVCTTNVDVRF